MIDNFLCVLPGEQITEEKINAVLKQSITTTFEIKHHLNEFYQRRIIGECYKATTPFVDMLKYYLRTKENEDYEKIVTDFMLHYEAFITALTEVLQSNRFDTYVFCHVSLAWTEVTEQLHLSAIKYSDIIANNISVQLLADINRIVDDSLAKNELVFKTLAKKVF